MEWASITREDLEQLLSSGLQTMDDTVQAAWAGMRIEPEKWQCSPWGDEGGGFWVVAEKDGQVVWYNDIENGFNISRFTTRGIIADYACNQTSFEELLLTLPEASEAENWSTPSGAVPPELDFGGTIVRRQTTYWDLRAPGGSSWRLRFKARNEARFVTSRFSELRLVDSHPILRQYVEPWSALYFTGTSIDPPKLGRALAELVTADSDGWRTLEEYLNGSVKLAGGGLLMRAPRGLVAKAAELLEQTGLTPSVLDGGQQRESPRAIIMDKNVIVAREFRFERLDPM